MRARAVDRWTIHSRHNETPLSIRCSVSCRCRCAAERPEKSARTAAISVLAVVIAVEWRSNRLRMQQLQRMEATWARVGHAWSAAGRG